MNLPPILIDALTFVGALAVVWIALYIFSGGESYQRRMKKRIAKLSERKTTRPQTAQEAISLRRKTNEIKSPLINFLMRPLPDFEKLANRLERAGYTISAKQFMLRCILAMLIIALLVKLMGKPFILGVCIGFILAVFLPLKLAKMKIVKQEKAFLRVFPDAIDLIVRGLRSGLPVSESVKLVATEIPQPVAGVFEHVANIMKLGVSLEKALQEIALKLDYTEFNFFVTSIILQRETGGNLSEILNNLSEVLRKRFLMKMKIKAMTSEARASAMIIGALPFIVIAAVTVLSPDYIKLLFTDYRGNIALGIATGLMCTGLYTMNRMAKFEI